MTRPLGLQRLGVRAAVPTAGGAADGPVGARGCVCVLVGVVAAAALAPVLPRGDVARGDRRGTPARLAEALLEEALGDPEADIDANQVHQLEGSHAKAAL